MPDLKEQFSNNSSYITGECYLTWTLKNRIFNYIIECDSIDSRLIIKANPAKNELTLIGDTIVDGLSFTIIPLFWSGDRKSYRIESSVINDRISINIVYDPVKKKRTTAASKKKEASAKQETPDAGEPTKSPFDDTAA